MTTRKTKEEAKEVWDMFHKTFPGLKFTIVVDKDGEQIKQIHILQMLKCRICGSEITTHAIGQHPGTCNTCTEKRERQTASQAKIEKARQYATWQAQEASIRLHGEEF